jgi:hypothetical protein
MATKQTLLEIRFAGGGVLPENIRAGEMADILSSVEDMLSGLVATEHPTLTKEQLVIGLVGIKSGSVNLQFSSQLPEITAPAFAKLASAIKTKDFSSLPVPTLKSLDKFSSFVRKRNCEAEFISRNGKSTVLATITPDIKVSLPDLLKGETIIYGRIIRVGGREPKAMIETSDGVTVYCDMENEDLARELGERLYMPVRIRGKATWEPHSLRLEEFKITEVADYGGSILEAFEELSSIAGKYFSNISDVESYVSDLRGQGLEE